MNPRRFAADWRQLAKDQAGVLARRQLIDLGHPSHFVDDQIAAERWQKVTDVVVCTTTGPLSREQLLWVGVLHAGAPSAIGGLTALERRGLEHWHRDEITVLLPKSHNLQPVSGIRFVETRRPVSMYATGQPPTWRVEPAALLFAGYTPHPGTALGLVFAVVQQRLTTPDRLLREIERMRPLRRASRLAQALSSAADGSHSLAERRVTRMCEQHRLPLPVRQVRRTDASGRVRYTDAEWQLSNGKIVILEVDGGFHVEVGHWTADIERERDLVATGAIVLRCTETELSDDPHRVAQSLRKVGVGESSA